LICWRSTPQAVTRLMVVPAMKPHVRRGRVAKEKRIERAKSRQAGRQKQAA